MTNCSIPDTVDSIGPEVYFLTVASFARVYYRVTRTIRLSGELVKFVD